MSKRDKTPAEIEHEFDSAEVPADEIKAMRPFSELLAQKRMGRPPKENPKEQVSVRYDSDIVAAFRATGDGWQTRMNDALRTYLTEHPLKAA
ncbi:BrnA antitoxin family protein [Paraburkholderia sp. J8-2]|uniref:BrnA antitoxin family protein n=1 Tax=Paraburkholderia sp. J8-2 TaxID=2805440 RepID=UPI002AB6D4CE|nr:BrnA antitoxin family protein [Paraburkholderia sp. J8-2]